MLERRVAADLKLELVQWKSHLGIGKQRFERTKWRHLEGGWKTHGYCSMTKVEMAALVWTFEMVDDEMVDDEIVTEGSR